MNIFDINIIHFDFVVLVCTSKNEKFWISNVDKKQISSWDPRGALSTIIKVLWFCRYMSFDGKRRIIDTPPTRVTPFCLYTPCMCLFCLYRFHFTHIFNHSCNLLNLLHSDHAKLILHFPLKESHLLLIQIGSLFFIWTVGKFIIVSSSATHLLVITKSPKH